MTVGVVGAGISGLALTHYLREQGVETVTFEATDRPGGMIQSRAVDGRVLELGPQRLRLAGPVKALVSELGLTDELREGHTDQPLYIYHDGAFREAPLSVRAAITTDLLSWRGKLRVLAEPLTKGPQPEESVEDFLTRKFGHEAAHRVFEPLYTGLYGSSADEMLVEYSLGKALERHGIEGSILAAVLRYVLKGRDPPPIVTFEDGLARLPVAIANRYADRIHFDTPVEAIESAGDGYEIHTPDGRTAIDAVALTTPAPVAADILEPLDETLAGTLREFNYNPIVMAHLHSTAELTGHGCQILPEAGYTTLGMTWNASMLDRDGVYTAYLGGSERRALLDRSDEEIGAIAAREFEDLHGEPAEVLSVNRWEPGMPAYDQSWTALDRLDPPAGIDFVTNYTERAGIIGRIADAKRTAERLAER
ncbi:protoporphyrinogen oxidase [Halodesulfurarchaeum sp. HSR-GB]|uniref:protoporphyrinogen oxidase n=1 Tax=Halodesulfurarchaeum sp. HSR-GB TaxID=3074077 RepID=UPI0028619F3A|nr:protoporphyrinogen oxidase [Halodesulfurarchaeum sp. HSR-GB]MDR5656028.1 protoporphyrinogen oxidase [Halodesulfurarchaeum sp. HSR-GB]